MNRKQIKLPISANSLILIIVMMIITVIFTAINKNFFTGANFVNILIASVQIGLTSIGITFLMMTGGTDLSAGAVAAACSVFVAWGLLNTGLSWVVLCLIALLIAAFAGLLNGLMVTKLKLVPFIATLVSQSLWKGVAFLICNGKPLVLSDKGLSAYCKNRLFGIPYTVYLMFVLFIIFGYILAKTKFGRSIFAIGGNAEAARLAGINSTKIKILCYVMTSVFAAMAGIILAGRMNSGNPASNANIHFDAITAANLGGVSMVGGVGSIPSVVLGVLLVQAFNSGLNMIGVSQYWQYVARGVLLFGSLAIDYYRQVAREKRLLADSMKHL